MTNALTIFGINMVEVIGVIAALASAGAAVCAFCVARRSSRFQKTVAKSKILDIQYRHEIEHLQKAIDGITELITGAIYIDYLDRNNDLDNIRHMIYNVKFSLTSLLSAQSSSSGSVDEWLHRCEDDNARDNILFHLRMAGVSNTPLDRVSDYIDVFIKRRNELIEIRDCRFREINDELWG